MRRAILGALTEIGPDQLGHLGLHQLLGDRPDRLADHEGRGIFYGLTVAEHFKLGAHGENLDANAGHEYSPAPAELSDRRTGLLSGGEQQMLAVGRALVRGRSCCWTS